jgi:epoxyqueuosine reductase QueG
MTNNSISLDELQEKLSFALQLDLEAGSAWMNDQEGVRFATSYPGLNKVISMILDLDTIDPGK